MSDAWFLDSGRYWVDPGETSDYPLRQGDVVDTPFLMDKFGWSLGLIVHPTCDIAKPNVADLQLCRIRPLDDLRDDFQKGLVVAGFQEKNGARLVAVANTFFIAPLPGGEGPYFADFHQIQSVPRQYIRLKTRAAAMTHDCRVSFLRRWFYFRFRISITMDQTRDAEAARIRADANFEGPRPDWAL